MTDLTKKEMDEVHTLAAELQGTCNDIDLDDYTLEFLRALDEIVMHCVVCGWWFETENFDEGDCCNECTEEGHSA